MTEIFDVATFPIDRTLAIVAKYLNRACSLNDRFSMSPINTQTNSNTHFHARSVPAIDLLAYFQRILKYCPCPNECLLAIAIYAERILVADPTFSLNSRSVHRLIIACLTIASKFFSDLFFTNLRYAKVGGIPVSELNRLEMDLLNRLQFRLFITIEDLNQLGQIMLENKPPTSLILPGFNLKNVNLSKDISKVESKPKLENILLKSSSLVTAPRLQRSQTHQKIYVGEKKKIQHKHSQSITETEASNNTKSHLVNIVSEAVKNNNFSYIAPTNDSLVYRSGLNRAVSLGSNPSAALNSNIAFNFVGKNLSINAKEKPYPLRKDISLTQLYVSDTPSLSPSSQYSPNADSQVSSVNTSPTYSSPSDIYCQKEMKPPAIISSFYQLQYYQNNSS